MDETDGTRLSGPGGMDANKTGRPTTKLDQTLKELGIKFKDKSLLEQYYKQLSAVFITDAMMASHAGMVLDLNSLPNDPIPFKEAFIKWLIEVNMPRLESGQQPVITYEVIMKCPLWRLVRPPLKRLEMTQEGLFSQPKVHGLIGRRTKIGSINKK